MKSVVLEYFMSPKATGTSRPTSRAPAGAAAPDDETAGTITRGEVAPPAHRPLKDGAESIGPPSEAQKKR